MTPARRSWTSDAITLAVCALAITLAFVLTPGSERVALLGLDIPELCLVRNVLGAPCPGCGLTRSWTYVAHFQLQAAFAMHPLGPVLFLAAAVQIPWRTVRLVRAALRRDAVEDPCLA